MSNPKVEPPKDNNIKVNKDGTISPIDPNKPSTYSTDFSEEAVIRAILLNMEWCHAVTTKSLDKATKEILEQIKLQQEALLSKLEAELPKPKKVVQPKIDGDTPELRDVCNNVGFNKALDTARVTIDKLRLEL
jgi:hypothetical protein